MFLVESTFFVLVCIVEGTVTGLNAAKPVCCTDIWKTLSSGPRRETFLGAFAKLREATISFVMSVPTDFHEIWYLSIFRKKNRRENSSFIKIGQE